MSTDISAARSIKARSKAKSRYPLKDGTIVPGATTIVGVLNKPALPYWANNLGLEGVRMKDYLDKLAAIGTAAHAAINADLLGQPAESVLDELDSDIRSLAENCYLSFCEWRKGHNLVPIMLETPLVSEEWRYGGTPDYVGLVDGVVELVDFKTGGIWPEHFIQLAAYARLLVENQVILEPPTRYRVLSLPRYETETFNEKVKTSVATEWAIFRHCLEIYELNKGIEK